MTRDQLEHAIRAACAVANDTELIVFGSQAILGRTSRRKPSTREQAVRHLHGPSLDEHGVAA